MMMSFSGQYEPIDFSHGFDYAVQFNVCINISDKILKAQFLKGVNHVT